MFISLNSNEAVKRPHIFRHCATGQACSGTILLKPAQINKRQFDAILSHCASNLRPQVIAVAAVLFDSVHATQKLYADFHRIRERTHSPS